MTQLIIAGSRHNFFDVFILRGRVSDGRPRAGVLAALIASATSMSLLKRVATWISLHPNNTAGFHIASVTRLYLL